MDVLGDAVLLSRLQFAVTTMLHIVWPIFSIGLSLFLVVLELLWLKTGDADWYRHARFWARLFLLNFGVGVVTGLPLEFEFGTNWATFSSSVGSFFGNILGFEGAMAFMLEAGFLGIMAFGWQRVSRSMHLFSTVMVASGASLSAFWIMSANAWMQTPAGGVMRAGKFELTSYSAAIFNPNMPWAASHMWVACVETSAFVIGGISAWYLLRGVHSAFFLKSFRLAFIATLILAPLQIFLGDGSGRNVFEHQPAKGAALEGHWETNQPPQGAPWALLAWPDKQAQRNRWSIEVPDVLSLLVTHSRDGEVRGLRAVPLQDQPPALPLLFYAFRLMVLIGFWLLFLGAWTAWVSRGGGFQPANMRTQRRLLQCWVATIPLGYIAAEAGWVVREVGRQPWIVYGLLRTREQASALPAGVVLSTLIAYTLVYLLLAFAFIVFARQILFAGPDMGLVPTTKNAIHSP